MQLPIDARNAPFKPKYIDEETPMLSFWFEFGKGCLVGGNCGNEDIFVNLSEEQVVAMVAARHTFCTQVLEILNASKYRTVTSDDHGKEGGGTS